jgi:hypothetical protein
MQLILDLLHPGDLLHLRPNIGFLFFRGDGAPQGDLAVLRVQVHPFCGIA